MHLVSLVLELIGILFPRVQGHVRGRGNEGRLRNGVYQDAIADSKG